MERATGSDSPPLSERTPISRTTLRGRGPSTESPSPLHKRPPHLPARSNLADVNKLIVTIDGPSGSGKSTVSRAVASMTELPHLDTGAFYRAATLAAIRAGVDLSDGDAVAKVVQGLALDQHDGVMTSNGEDVSDEIRGEIVTGAVSEVSAHPQVRWILVDHERDWVDRHEGRAVVEGRDIGSVVFPDATVKIYLDARAEVRAVRRATQDDDDPKDVLADLEARDHKDSTRQTSPLTVPDGALLINTSDLSFDEVVANVVSLVSGKS